MLRSITSLKSIHLAIKKVNPGKGIQIGNQIARKYSRLSDPTSNPLNVVNAIIGANILVWGGWMIAAKDRQKQWFMIKNFTVSYFGVFHEHRYHTIFTAMFSHLYTFHLAMNMYVLHSFGATVLSMLGSSRFLVLYLGGGLVSSLSQALWPALIPKSWPARCNFRGDEPGLGASGAISAVLSYYIFKFPRSTVLFFGIVPMPAAILGLGFIGFDLYSLYDGSGQVGNAAHLGGAAYGALYFLLFRRRLL